MSCVFLKGGLDVSGSGNLDWVDELGVEGQEGRARDKRDGAEVVYLEDQTGVLFYISSLFSMPL